MITHYLGNQVQDGKHQRHSHDGLSVLGREALTRITLTRITLSRITHARITLNVPLFLFMYEHILTT